MITRQELIDHYKRYIILADKVGLPHDFADSIIHELEAPSPSSPIDENLFRATLESLDDLLGWQSYAPRGLIDKARLASLQAHKRMDEHEQKNIP